LKEVASRYSGSLESDDAGCHLEDPAAEFGVSRERVRQIEARVFQKVQNAVRHRVAAMEWPEALAVR
jgi:DNA-directed RNA polymerase sigma subunit (sigma70/sigma32)